MGEARLGLSMAEDDCMLEGLVVYLAEWAEGARISIAPGDMSSKVAGTCAHQVNAATYTLWKASEGMSSKAGTVEV